MLPDTWHPTYVTFVRTGVACSAQCSLRRIPGGRKKSVIISCWYHE
jgi:hypothetical protein